MADSKLDNRKTNFLLKHQELAISYICRYYPFSFLELDEFKDDVEWYHISLNHNVEWSYELIDHFAEKLDFNKPNYNYFPGFFCLNHGLPWSIEFIKRYEHLWDWNTLMYNSILTRDKEIYSYMQQTYLQYTTEEHRLNALSQQKKMWYNDFDMYENDFEFELTLISNAYSVGSSPHSTWKDVETDTDADWDLISNNQVLPWSTEIIEKYKTKINFRKLCWNTSVPWSVALISKYFFYFRNFSVNVGEKYKLAEFMNVLSLNIQFPWNLENITKFEKIVSFGNLSVNIGVEWNIDLLEKYKKKWWYPALYDNRSIIPKAFPELRQSEVMKELWLEILKRKRNAKQKL